MSLKSEQQHKYLFHDWEMKRVWHNKKNKQFISTTVVCAVFGTSAPLREDLIKSPHNPSGITAQQG